MTSKLTALKLTLTKLAKPTFLKSLPKAPLITPPLLTKTAPLTLKTILLTTSTKLGLYGLAFIRKLGMIAVGFCGVYMMVVEWI
jgi:hypothetical protein